MVVAENDPLKSLLNSIQVAFSPLESNFQNLAKNIEHCFNGVLRNEALDFDDRRKGEVRMKIRVGVDREKCRSNDESRANFWHGIDKVKVNSSKKQLQEEMSGEDSSCLDDSSERVEVGERMVGGVKLKKLNVEEGNDFPFDHLMRFLFDRLSHFPKFDVFVQDHECKNTLKALTGYLKGKRVCRDGFFANLRFARIGVPSVKDVEEEYCSSEVIGSEKLGNELLRNRFFKCVSMTELVELLPQIRRSSKELLSVEDFFRYTEAEGMSSISTWKRFFEELDRDGDGQVTLEDLEIAMASRNLPRRYAKEFLQRTRTRFFSKSFGWREFLSVMEQKEPTILRAYTSLRLSKSRTPQKDEIFASLENAGLSAHEDNATAMMQFLNADDKESKSYGHFRNFMVLLPSNHLPEKPRRNGSRRDTVADAPRVEIQTDSVLKTALAGGISCSFSTFLMHPIDTVKTQVQASSTLSFAEILSKLPQLGLRGLYMGSIPAIVGQFSSHGLRTGICEVTKIVLINVAPTLPEIQVESAGSFLGTFLGTTMRIPCEVLKQRLQAGQFNHVGEAMVGIWQQDGLNGFFRGTGMTLCRELPFYVAGSGLYAESKKAVRKLLGRELEPWETIAVGAISGGLTAVMTTPFDVIKTRMMTALQGEPVTMSVIALSILRHEGPLGLFRGAVPRFFWVAPLGAINFAGYDLIRKAMD
ncbi:mitochondrial substrate carrier family protein [Perilla frutescens var. frutescens]|nr:mitochondrial substrate carrier family protein [Perilla frutescens var. frutescens]